MALYDSLFGSLMIAADGDTAAFVVDDLWLTQNPQYGPLYQIINPYAIPPELRNLPTEVDVIVIPAMVSGTIGDEYSLTLASVQPAISLLKYSYYMGAASGGIITGIFAFAIHKLIK